VSEDLPAKFLFRLSFRPIKRSRTFPNKGKGVEKKKVKKKNNIIKKIQEHYRKPIPVYVASDGGVFVLIPGQLPEEALRTGFNADHDHPLFFQHKIIFFF
jgi:hypothetical protein